MEDPADLQTLAGWFSSLSDRLLATWAEGFSALPLEGVPSLALLALLGTLLLVAGRRLFWFALASLGFLLGWHLATLALGPEEPAVFWVGGLAGGLVGMLVAALARRLGTALAGLAVGLILGAKLLPWTPLAGTPVGLGLPLATGILGVLLGHWMLDLALRVATAGVGAALLVAALPVPPLVELIAFLALWLVGCGWQRPHRGQRS